MLLGLRCRLRAVDGSIREPPEWTADARVDVSNMEPDHQAVPRSGSPGAQREQSAVRRPARDELAVTGPGADHSENSTAGKKGKGRSASNLHAMPPDAHTLSERLRRDYDSFSPAQQALARYLVDHIAELPLLSAHEIAHAAHCSPATVVRFAQALGYSGYPELQRTVRAAQRPALPPRRAGQLGLFTGRDGIENLFAADHLALDDALARIGEDGIAPFASALLTAETILIAAEGHARAVAALIQERLERAGRSVVHIDQLDVRSRARLAHMGVDVGVLAVAVGRETAVAEAALQAARSRGCSALALADSSLSPLARAPRAMIVPADERGAGAPGLVAFVAVAQVLAEAISHASAGRSLEATPGVQAA